MELAFSIETRLGTLPEIVRFVDESLARLDEELKQSPQKVDAYAQGQYGWPFDDDEALRRVLFGSASFIAESRACFEHLAEFYREFVHHYFLEPAVSEKDSYAKIAELSEGPKWADYLRGIRHETLHYSATWLELEVEPGPPRRYEPVLVFDRNITVFGSREVTFESLRGIRDGLQRGAKGLCMHLIHRVETW